MIEAFIGKPGMKGMVVFGVDGKCCKTEGVDRGATEGGGTCLETRCEVI